MASKFHYDVSSDKEEFKRQRQRLMELKTEMAKKKENHLNAHISQLTDIFTDVTLHQTSLTASKTEADEAMKELAANRYTGIAGPDQAGCGLIVPQSTGVSYTGSVPVDLKCIRIQCNEVSANTLDWKIHAESHFTVRYRDTCKNYYAVCCVGECGFISRDLAVDLHMRRKHANENIQTEVLHSKYALERKYNTFKTNEQGVLICKAETEKD